MPEFDTYLSPFSWRYGSPAMRRLWSENNKRLLWRQLWVALAEIQAEYGLVTAEQIDDLRAHQGEIDLPQALAIEAELQHDLMAEVRVFANQCTLGGGIIHLGATSTDIEDNTDALRLRDSLDLILLSLNRVITHSRPTNWGMGRYPNNGFHPLCSRPNRPRWDTACPYTDRTCWRITELFPNSAATSAGKVSKARSGRAPPTPNCSDWTPCRNSSKNFRKG